jgi:hypothetical protein
MPVSIAERSKLSTVYDRLNIEIAGSNLARGMDVCLRVSVLCCRCPVGRQRPCVGLIPQPRSPTKCLWIKKSIKEGQGPIRTVEASWKKKICIIYYHSVSLHHTLVQFARVCHTGTPPI